MNTTRMMAVAMLIVGSGLGAPRIAGAASRNHARRCPAARSGRSWTRSHPGPRRFCPGVAFGRHSHPGAEVVYVLEGTLEYQLDGEPPVTLKAGEALFIPSGTIHAARNVGKGNGAELATYIVEKGKPLVAMVK